jgi:glucokinase
VIGAVDIGGTKIAAGIVDNEGKVLSRLETPAAACAVYADSISCIARMLREAARLASVELTGIGIGSTGWVYPFSGEFGDMDFFPRWKGCNSVKDLTSEFNVSVALENDGDASALGEAAWGAGKGKSRMIYVTVGTGIGGGIILDEHLYRGADRSHPEIGHHIVDASGPQCTCGFRGCWEALATGTAMATWFKNQASADGRAVTDITAREIFQLAKQGDSLAEKTVRRENYYLGLGIANLINLFMPEMIVLGGSIMKGVRLDDLAKIVAQGCRFVPFKLTRLAHASLGEDANLIGAARVWHHRFEPNAIDNDT